MPLIVARATAQFLHSPTGVKQALFMAKTEMEVVTEDKWSDDVWGVANNEGDSSERSHAPLIFYFGAKASSPIFSNGIEDL